MVSTPQALITNTWVKASWDEFLALANAAEAHTELKKARFYYDNGQMRIEDMPIGFSHSRGHGLLSSTVTLYGTFKNLNLLLLDNGSFRKAGEQECQPDIAFYAGSSLPNIPPSNAPIDVNLYGPPSLAIEISASSLSDDLGQKRLLYERLGVSEYWVVDVEATSIIAFSISNGGSYSIKTSAVISGLQLDIVEEALRRNQTEDVCTVSRWLVEQFGRE